MGEKYFISALWCIFFISSKCDYILKYLVNIWLYFFH